MSVFCFIGFVDNQNNIIVFHSKAYYDLHLKGHLDFFPKTSFFMKDFYLGLRVEISVVLYKGRNVELIASNSIRFEFT